MHPCIHVSHLDLVDIGQNMSTTDRLMGNPNPMKKISNHLTLRPRNPKIHGNVPRFRPDKIFFILTLHTHRQSLDWPLISILTSQPIHEACSGPWKASHMFSIYEKTINHKTSRKVSFGSYRGPLQIPIDIAPMSSTLHAINRQFVFRPERATYSSGHNSDSSQHEFFWIFTKPCQIDWHLHANLWVKIPNIHRSRISGLFQNVENSQKVGT